MKNIVKFSNTRNRRNYEPRQFFSEYMLFEYVLNILHTALIQLSIVIFFFIFKYFNTRNANNYVQTKAIPISIYYFKQLYAVNTHLTIRRVHKIIMV